jgi:hypothetical protein
MKPSIGRIVRYVLSQSDAQHLNTRRMVTRAAGTQCTAGQCVPAMITKVWWGTDAVNLRVILDGEDNHWVQSRTENAEKSPGSWHWPEREEAIVKTFTGETDPAGSTVEETPEPENEPAEDPAI